jgi:hypothetical protein
MKKGDKVVIRDHSYHLALDALSGELVHRVRINGYYKDDTLYFICSGNFPANNDLISLCNKFEVNDTLIYSIEHKEFIFIQSRFIEAAQTRLQCPCCGQSLSEE